MKTIKKCTELKKYFLYKVKWSVVQIFWWRILWALRTNKQCCGSEIVFFGFGSGFSLNFGIRISGLFMKNTSENCRSTKLRKKHFNKSVHFYSFEFVSWKQNLLKSGFEPGSQLNYGIGSEPNLQIFWIRPNSDPQHCKLLTDYIRKTEWLKLRLAITDLQNLNFRYS